MHKRRREQKRRLIKWLSEEWECSALSVTSSSHYLSIFVSLSELLTELPCPPSPCPCSFSRSRSVGWSCPEAHSWCKEGKSQVVCLSNVSQGRYYLKGHTHTHTCNNAELLFHSRSHYAEIIEYVARWNLNVLHCCFSFFFGFSFLSFCFIHQRL